MTTGEGVRRVRGRVFSDGIAFSLPAFAFGIVYGLAAREGGLSIVEAMAMSAFSPGRRASQVPRAGASRGGAWRG